MHRTLGPRQGNFAPWLGSDGVPVMAAPSATIQSTPDSAPSVEPPQEKHLKGLQSIACRTVVTLLTMAALVACGGGGGDDPSTEQLRAPLPQLVQNDLPAGTRIDVSADDFFPFSAGDRATYSSATGSGEAINVVREVIVPPDAQGRVVVRESVPGRPNIETRTERWQARSDGLYALDFLGDGAPDAFRALVGDILYYPTPFYPQGTTRRVIRQGSLGTDIDGDGINESFRLEFEQQFLGFSSATRGGRAERHARFSNTVTLRVEPSRRDRQTATIRTTEEIIFASHLGVIGAARSETINGAVDGNRQANTYSALQLISGTLAGRDVNTAWNAGTLRYVQLSHYDLVYEPVNRFYYAGLRLEHAAAPGAVARIRPDTGEVAYSGGLGADVRSIAVSADGTTLYAGLQNRNEVVRLSLPDLQVVQRIALDPGSWAYGLSVSPSNAGEVAAYPDNSQRGPMVIRDGTVLPGGPGRDRARSGATDESLLYSADGSQLFMISDQGRLLRMGVGSAGLSSAVESASAQVLGRALSREGSHIVAGKARYSATDLALLAGVADINLGDCRPLNGTAKWACKRGSANNVAVLDSGTLTMIPDGLVPYARPNDPNFDSLYRIVPGPRGQIALMVATRYSFGGDWVGLFDNPDFR